MKEEYIKKEAWSKIFSFLKSRNDIYIKDEGSCKMFIESIYWMARTGAQWRELESSYGKWNSIYKRFKAWSEKNIWSELLEFCIEDPDLEYVMVDATIVRAHPCAAGFKKDSQARQALGRSKGGFSTKIHAKVDALGNVLKLIITPGQRNEATQATTLLEGYTGEYTLGDRAYDSNEIRKTIKEKGSKAVIPPQSNRIIQHEYDKHIYKERHAIECFFGKIKHFRRIFSRYDKEGRTYAAFLSFVGAILWLR
jgi:transposase